MPSTAHPPKKRKTSTLFSNFLRNTYETSGSQRKNKVPNILFLKLEKWQGPPQINKVNQYEMVTSVKDSLLFSFLFGLFAE